jgi:ABC-type hemin transport system substrate-binding protein
MKRLLSALLPFWTSAAFAFPVTVDSRGTSLTFDAPPTRAIVHDMNMAEMAFALELQPSIVGLTGITGWYKVSPEFEAARGAIPELTPRHPSLENIVAVEPDFVFAGWGYGLRPENGVTPDTLAPYGIKTLVLTESCIHKNKDQPAASMDLLYGDMLKLGRIFGKEEEAERLVTGWKESSRPSRRGSVRIEARASFSSTPARTDHAIDQIGQDLEGRAEFEDRAIILIFRLADAGKVEGTHLHRLRRYPERETFVGRIGRPSP